jgi:glycosyltransferase involved in cell wall biosynthesis
VITVTIVTPTMVGREIVLLDRCIPSVQRQSTSDLVVEHLVVSDPNPDLAKQIREDYPYVQFVQLNDTWRDGLRDQSIGAFPWYIGSMLAQGDYVGFLGDDDELLSHHVNTHIDMMETTGADFSVSRVEFQVDGNVVFTVGHPGMAWTQLDSDGVMCRRSALRHANWDPFDLEPPTADAADYRLVRDWKTAGLNGVFIDVITAIHHNGWAGGAT